MREEFITYASLNDAERDAIALPPLDATSEELALFWNAVNQIRDEQPDSSAMLNAGAMRGEAPFSYTSESEVQ